MGHRYPANLWIWVGALSLALFGCQLRAADASQPPAKPKPAPKWFNVKRAQQDACNFTFPNFIDVSACAGFNLKWSSQSVQVDHATGNFSTTWSPNEPHVLTISGHLDSTSLSATLVNANGPAPTGTVSAIGNNFSYSGMYTLGADTGPVTINVVMGGGGGDGGDDSGPAVNVALTPNPAKVGDTVTMKGTVTPEKGATISPNDMGVVDFGDGSATTTVTATTFLTQIKTGFTHVYTTPGVYTASIYFFNTDDTPGNGERFTFVEVVGANSVSVDASNGAFVTAQVADGGTVGLQINAMTVANAVGASTTFEDAGGVTVPQPNGPLQGFSVQQPITLPGLVVGTSQVLDANAGALVRLRKTSGVSEKRLGMPNALSDPMSTQIAMKSVKGKFTFNLSTPDDVVFSGQFLLPPGFAPGRSGAETLQFSMGNVVDTVHLSAKGVASLGDRSRIKKLSLRLPKLPTGVATGTEIVKITMDINAKNLTGLGFNTEGITSARGINEQGLKSVTRFIQMNMLFAGVAYESLLPVKYTISTKGDFGTFIGR